MRVVFALLGGLVVAAAGSIAWAAVPDGANMVHGCYASGSTGRTGGAALSVIDSDRGGKCGRGQTELVFNQRGPQGPPGPASATGLYILNSGTVTVGGALEDTNGWTSAWCDQGDVIQSGGFLRNQSGPGGTWDPQGEIVGSFPAEDGFTQALDGWTVGWMNGAPGEWFVAYAVCVDNPPLR